MPRRMSESELSMLGRLGAHSMHAKHDSKRTSEPGRLAFLNSFEKQAIPTGHSIRKSEHVVPSTQEAHFTRLAMLSAQKRRKA